MMRLLLMLALCSSACTHPVLKLASTIPFHQAHYLPTQGTNLIGPLTELIERVRSWGLAVEFVDMEPYGSYSRNEGIIRLRSGMPPNATFEVLAHEIGHVVSPPALDDATGQVFAELVGWAIAKHYGHDATRISGTYLAAYKHRFEAVPHLKVDLAFAIDVALGRVPIQFPPRECP